MAADTTVVKPVDAPPLTPLNLKSRLAPTPAGPPKYSVTVKNAAGADVALGDPRATRALVALMDVHAVNGGAACHWGGPAAFAWVGALFPGAFGVCACTANATANAMHAEAARNTEKIDTFMDMPFAIPNMLCLKGYADREH